MNIDKAIEILYDLTRPGLARTFSPQEGVDAKRLGIEALKGVRKVRDRLNRDIKASLLPGETLD